IFHLYLHSLPTRRSFDLAVFLSFLAVPHIFPRSCFLLLESKRQGLLFPARPLLLPALSAAFPFSFSTSSPHFIVSSKTSVYLFHYNTRVDIMNILTIHVIMLLYNF